MGVNFKTSRDFTLSEMVKTSGKVINVGHWEFEEGMDPSLLLPRATDRLLAVAFFPRFGHYSSYEYASLSHLVYGSRFSGQRRSQSIRMDNSFGVLSN